MSLRAKRSNLDVDHKLQFSKDRFVAPLLAMTCFSTFYEILISIMGGKFDQDFMTLPGRITPANAGVSLKDEGLKIPAPRALPSVAFRCAIAGMTSLPE